MRRPPRGARSRIVSTFSPPDGSSRGPPKRGRQDMAAHDDPSRQPFSSNPSDALSGPFDRSACQERPRAAPRIRSTSRHAVRTDSHQTPGQEGCFRTPSSIPCPDPDENRCDLHGAKRRSCCWGSRGTWTSVRVRRMEIRPRRDGWGARHGLQKRPLRLLTPTSLDHPLSRCPTPDRRPTRGSKVPPEVCAQGSAVDEGRCHRHRVSRRMPTFESPEPVSRRTGSAPGRPPRMTRCSDPSLRT